MPDCVTQEKILWIALPRGICPRGTLRLSVFVSPRLEGPTTDRCELGAMSSFADWPRTVGQSLKGFRLKPPKASFVPARW